jgi:pimeloyl-ACP methyl ester carboxylesterase
MKSKRTWILLRGLAREKGHWGPFADQFASSFQGDEVLAMDLPGAGEFRGEPCPRSVEEICRFVRAKAVERAKSQSQFYLVALSLGGMIAMEWMRQKPDDLAGCVLINSSSKALSPPFLRLRWQVWGKFAKLAAASAPRDREKLILDLTVNSAPARDKALPLWYRLAVEHPIRYSTLANQLWAASQFKGLPETKVPVLLLCGLGDRLVDPSCSMALEQKMEWPLMKHPWAGHDLTWDDPQWVLQQVRSWSEASVESTRP